MNSKLLEDLEREFKQADAWLQDLLYGDDSMNLRGRDPKAFRLALAEAKYRREVAMIERDSAWLAQYSP